MIDHALSAARLNLELGRYSDALKPLRVFERRAEKHADRLLDSHLLRMRLALRMNEYKLLLELSDKIAEEAPNNIRAQFERERILNTALRDHGDTEKLPASIDRLLSLQEGLPNGGGSAFHRALSRSLLKVGDIRGALDSSRKGLELAHDEDDIRAFGNASLALAEALRYAHEERQSVEHYLTGIEIGRDIGNRDSELWCWLGLACAHLQIGEREEAESALDVARGLTTDPGFKHPLETAHVGLIQALARMLSKSPVNFRDVLKPYSDLGIGWPEQFLSETQSKGELPRAIPI